MLISTDQLEAAAITPRAFCGRDTAALAEAELLAALDAASRAQRASTVLLAQLSGEVALRSDPEVGMGLAKQQGFGSAPQFVANLTGGSLGDARRLVEAGAELCGPLPSPSAPPTPLARAIASNEISVEAGALIRKTLQEMRAENPALDTSDVELRLVQRASCPDNGGPRGAQLLDLRARDRFLQRLDRTQPIHTPSNGEQRARQFVEFLLLLRTQLT